jgi:hypothetical protein
MSILILSKTYPSVITTSPTLDMIGFLATRVSFAEKQQDYVLTFKILAQVLVGYSFLRWQAISRISCTIQLIKHNIHQLPSLGISCPVE